MFSMIELIGIYGEINTNIIKNDLERNSQEFRQATDILLGLRENLESIPLIPVLRQGSSSLRSQSLWNFYRKDLLSDKEMENAYKIKMPKIITNESVLKTIATIEKLTKQF